MGTNDNGWTFGKWLRIANFGRRSVLRIDVARAAWKRNVDPTYFSVR